jgi:hypothetical protein
LKGLPVLVQAGVQDPRAAKLEAKVRLHTQFDLARGVPIRIDVTEGVNRYAWAQVFSARARKAALSCPRAGGELNSEPTTEKRNRAQEAEVDRPGCWGINVSSQKGWKRH